MALKCCLALGAMLAAGHALALEALDESSLSDVTGQAQGLRYTSEFDARIDSITYIDDDGLAGGEVGTISMSPVRVYTPTNRPVQVDLEVRDVGGEKALVFTNRDLPFEVEVGSIAINNQSLGGYGQGNFQIGSGDSLVTYLYAGGYQGNGLKLDIEIPASMSYDTWIEDEGARFTTTVDFSDPYNPSSGGIVLKDITFDLVGEGLRIGLPTVTGGNINFYNARIGDDVLNSVALRDINLQPGGYLLVKNARGAAEYGLEFDAVVKAGSSLDYVYIAGAVDGDYPSADVFEMSAGIVLASDYEVNGMRMNLDGERGLVFDFDTNDATSGVTANVIVQDFTLMRSDKVATTVNPISLGTMDIQMNLSNASYLQVEGH
ncbi:DUF6160 family protein [Thalassolituus sp. LLYu03]|uniref:DUF6160 family protein n=1 Tax=Thalassolituus sp. LLYu03 TaxID=3421656 RepID=UPI003D2D9423